MMAKQRITLDEKAELEKKVEVLRDVSYKLSSIIHVKHLDEKDYFYLQHSKILHAQGFIKDAISKSIKQLHKLM